MIYAKNKSIDEIVKCVLRKQLSLFNLIYIQVKWMIKHISIANF